MDPEQPDKKKTVKLKIDHRINFLLIGISSHENDYRLVWSMNEHLKLQFVRTGNLVVHQPKLASDLEFGRFGFYDEDRYVKFCLISNSCPDGFLFKELKNFDYLLQITGNMSDQEIKDLLKKVKSVPVVSAAFILQPEKIKGIAGILVE